MCCWRGVRWSECTQVQNAESVTYSVIFFPEFAASLPQGFYYLWHVDSKLITGFVIAGFRPRITIVEATWTEDPTGYSNSSVHREILFSGVLWTLNVIFEMTDVWPTCPNGLSNNSAGWTLWAWCYLAMLSLVFSYNSSIQYSVCLVHRLAKRGD